MKRAKYSIKKSIKKGLATLLSVCLIVSGVQTPVYAAEASIPTESTATVSGLVNKKVVLDLLSDDLRDAALTAIRENRLFDAGDYLGATSDSKKAIKEYEAFFNRNPGLYVVEVPDSVKDILSSEAESELRIFVQKDEKKAKVDLEDENATDESVLSRDVNFRYGTEDDIILYEPSSQIDTLVNGGEDAYYRDPEQDTADNSDYQLTGKEKITFMFINASDGSVRFTLKVDGVKYDSVEVCGRTAALKRVLAQAGVKKTEETTAAVVQTTQAVETTQAPELVNIGTGAIETEELTQPGEENIQEGIADTSEIITPEDNENGSTEISNPVTAEQEAGAGESTDIENGADTEDNNQGYIEADTNTSQQELTENNAAEQTNDDTAVVTDDDSAELTNNDAAELTDNDTAEISDTEDNANVENEDGAQAQIEDIEDNEDSITDQISDAVDNVSNIILGRMVVYAEVIGEGYVFEEEQQGPETEEEEKNEDIAAEAGNTDGNDNDAADKQEIQADLDDNNGAAEGGQQGGQEYGQEEGQQDGQEIEQQSDGLGTETLEQNDGSGAEIVGQNEAGSGNESNVTIVDIFTEDNQEEGVQNDTTSTEISTGDVPETVIEGTIPEGQMTLEDLTGMMAEPETTAAAEIQKPETTVKMPVASPSEVEETSGEYDDFAKALIAEVKEAVLEDKEAAKEDLKVAKIVQYSIGSLGKIHYLTEIDGYSVEIFAAPEAFGGFKPNLEVKRLYKPEENDGTGDTPTDAEIAELKANGIYDNSLLLDISFKNDVGDEVEPDGNVNVRITLNDEDLLKKIDASSLEVHHIKDNNSTLTTEKVAEKEEVKILDGNDVQISDSDLEAHAEAIAAGEESDVEVASAVAEFEVSSFSVFAITWYDNDTTLLSFIQVHYVDINGNEILDPELDGQSISLPANGLTLASIEGGVTNYDYKEARLGSTNGQVITKVAQGTSNQQQKHYVDYFNGSEMVARNTISNNYKFKATEYGWVDQSGHELVYEVEPGEGYDYYIPSEGGNRLFKHLGERTGISPIYSLDYYQGAYHVTEYTGDRYVYESLNPDYDVYFIYTPKDYEPGGDPQVVDLGAPAANKELTENGDGTYNLTLSVTGKSHAQESKTKANVVVVLDLSGSMGNSAPPVEPYSVSEYGNYYKEGNDYKQLYVRSSWGWGYTAASDGTQKTVYTKNGNTYTEYHGTRYSKNANGTRLDVAKAAINSLADTLLANNTENDPDAVEIGLVTFATRTEVYSPTTDAETFKSTVNGLKANGGTNWEGGLLDANGYSFGLGDDDPVYVIFVSDGKPTFRTNANGHTSDFYSGSEDVYGNGQEGDTNVARCLNAAVKASTALIGANKRLYAVNAFSGNGATGAENNMKALFGTSTPNYFNATDQIALNAAFGKIIKEIENDLAYANVSIVDGITNLTATMEVLGTTGNYTYQIVKTDGEGHEVVTENANVPEEIKTASYENGTVNWDVGGNGYRLEDGATYKVSFTVWPKQEAYDLLADVGNGKVAVENLPAGFVTDENGNVVYRTNTGASVSYQTVNVVTEDGHETITYSDVKTSPINVYPTMNLTDTKVSFQKKWKLDNPSQSRLFTHDTIQINLQRKNEAGEYANYFATPLSLDGTGAVTSEDGLEITWTNDREIDIAPGILVSEANGNVHGFNKEGSTAQLLTVEGTNQKYYLVEKGHDYRFDEKVGNASFELQEVVYHPMVVDGTLKSVELTYDGSGNITGIKSLGDVEELTTLIATNVVKLDLLEVSKKYLGNMATAQETAFDLYLFAEDGTTPAVYTENYIESLNEDGTTVVKQSDGAYRFTITPTTLGTPATATIVLPTGVKYKVSEVKENKDYATYKTKWGVAENAITNESSITSIQVLGTVNAIYFVNENNVIAPTGFNDDMRPFMALALAGFGAMFFLACDFEKKRMFED
ncbi:von Willebrand factor type A domain-containing protein [Oribacterium sp. KHPX15]|uniref:vWA domain-containing protein n=1 Tax=Oribacterium sp. KHPX15 TaxID=1855342 RepID=UPI00089BCB6F|nr:vWA domain-containing protein [Oribacterium sp. KHPX15]SEA73225.1 von Willebrand factor type A domain-containing protein [Oribacterium sp. KHPX15]